MGLLSRAPSVSPVGLRPEMSTANGVNKKRNKKIPLTLSGATRRVSGQWNLLSAGYPLPLISSRCPPSHPQGFQEPQQPRDGQGLVYLFVSSPIVSQSKLSLNLAQKAKKRRRAGGMRKEFSWARFPIPRPRKLGSGQVSQWGNDDDRMRDETHLGRPANTDCMYSTGYTPTFLWAEMMT